MTRKVYTADEVAEMLGISRGLCYDLLNSGQIPSIRLGTRFIIPIVRFEAWLASLPDSYRVQDKDNSP